MLPKISFRFLPIPLESETHEAKLFRTRCLRQKTEQREVSAGAARSSSPLRKVVLPNDRLYKTRGEFQCIS